MRPPIHVESIQRQNVNCLTINVLRKTMLKIFQSAPIYPQTVSFSPFSIIACVYKLLNCCALCGGCRQDFSHPHPIQSIWLTFIVFKTVARGAPTFFIDSTNGLQMRSRPTPCEENREWDRVHYFQ